jgi:uncharacterized protein DUF6941
MGTKVTMMLADYAQVAEGKLMVVGGGWNVTGPQPVPFAIAGTIDVPWSETNQNHTFRFDLVDLDGNAVEVETPEGEQPLFFEGTFQVGRPAGVRPGSPIPFHFAMVSGPIPLAAGQHYVWQLAIDGQEHEDWRLAFSTRPDSQSAAA